LNFISRSETYLVLDRNPHEGLSVGTLCSVPSFRISEKGAVLAVSNTAPVFTHWVSPSILRKYNKKARPYVSSKEELEEYFLIEKISETEDTLGFGFLYRTSKDIPYFSYKYPPVKFTREGYAVEFMNRIKGKKSHFRIHRITNHFHEQQDT